MNESSPLLLLGIGTAGCSLARGIQRAFGASLRCLMADTDAASGREGESFVLLGGDRLSGHGAGGDLVSARLAAEDSIDVLDDSIEGVRLAVIVTALGGGTGSGATREAVKHLNARGVPSVVFATLPFAFEGEARHKTAQSVAALIEEDASASFFIPLDKLIGETDNMADALRRGLDTLASAVTLFWRLVETPGYIRLDTERIRHLIANAGRGRFATITTQGPSRVNEALDALTRSPLLTDGTTSVTKILCGVLAGEDLRLSEISKISDGLRNAFGPRASFELATVNDEQTFSGRLAIVAMLFESNGKMTELESETGASQPRKTRAARNPLATGPKGRGRFNNAEATIWNNEDLDLPTFIRRNITLDF